MKQIITILSFFLCLSVNAQIQRTFFGLELGNSNKEQVIEKVKSMGKQYTTKADEVKTHNVKFGEFDWADVQFGFKDDKLIAVCFTSRVYPLSEKSKAETDSELFYLLLKNKYNEYKVMDYDGSAIYFDKATASLILSKKNNRRVEKFMLVYADGIQVMEMMNKMQNDL